MDYKLRDYQRQAVDTAMIRLRGAERRILLALTTGMGKSRVLAALASEIRKQYPQEAILILTRAIAIREQLITLLGEYGVWTDKDGIDSIAVTVLTYQRLLDLYKSGAKTLPFAFVLCDEALDAEDPWLMKRLDRAAWVGFTSDDTPGRLRKSWFAEAEVIYRYVLEDAVRDGVVLPSGSMHAAAVEGFCKDLLSQWDYFVTSQPQMRGERWDYLVQTENHSIIVECKSYRTRGVHVSNIRLTVEKMALWIEKNPGSTALLILFGEIAESYKQEIFAQNRVTIWDMANLIYYAKESPQLLERLAQLSFFPIAGIEPVPSQGWQPIRGEKRHTEEETVPGTPEESLEHRLRRCGVGRAYDKEYEQLCSEIVRYLFREEFAIASDQHKTGDRLFRMDLICSLKGSSAFWELLIRHYNSRFIVFEYKNYGRPLQQNLIYTTEKYLFDAALRNVAVIISRKGFSQNALLAAEGCLKESRKLILDITDTDLIEMLHRKADGLEPADYLLEKLERQLMSIGK